MNRRALPYNKFIQVLQLLECFIPAIGELGQTFLIYRWGGGYNSKPGAPFVPFIHRTADEPVTLLEIETITDMLEITDEFWQHADRCMIEPDRPTPQPHPQAKKAAP